MQKVKIIEAEAKEVTLLKDLPKNIVYQCNWMSPVSIPSYIMRLSDYGVNIRIIQFSQAMGITEGFYSYKVDVLLYNLKKMDITLTPKEYEQDQENVKNDEC